MEKPKKSVLPAIIIGAILILMLPLTYFLVAKVILPLEWNEPQFKESVEEVESD